ncbi:MULTISPECIES: NAD(P)H-dependent flavin oxidoreductase [Alphaproteobacteria]|jgi:nitronate monooxygenase|uniref:Nitronate monooxygenase n=3 Tax=Alphaproteobacteria TaxID=28211 RepID=A0ABY2QI34_9SPHN|nr:MULTISPECIES: nitronate monooxygenase family protein [Alphaproteobacteria]KKI19757.1 2-nitropropane dioxygenase [Sphingomonas sp. Ag1]MCD2317246.1 nitronate monooxygenase family protein [Sphingomonas sp. IC-11]MCH4894410.1 nitronate monooxygenase [Sphingomonas sp. SFZ2018-12]MDO7836835.1 nitronate monooxygenase family protein [Sphingobium sp. HBC34]MDR6790086.1 NAD(P)H-dependent flavin oxidoreductase YrpB (nitropropane dioxygenase family) [Sphingomonas sp. BE138]
MALNSRICGMLGIDYPIVLAGMGGASVPRLAAAVSNAGGLGVLGAAACSPEQLRAWIRETRALTDKPFGVDTLLPASVRRGSAPQTGAAPADPRAVLADYQAFTRDFMEREGLEIVARDSGRAVTEGAANGGAALFSKEFFEAQMEVVVEEKVPVYAAGLGNPGPWMDRLHANGTVVMAVVGKVKHALQVVESGIDVIVAQGHDGGGHNSPIGTISLIPQVVDAVGDRVPVLGAGGISDGRGVAAAFMLGAEGAWVGTAFLATEEAGIEDFQKEAIVDSGDADTVVSRSITGKPARMIRSKWADAWVAAGKEPLPMPYQSMIAGPVMASGIRAKRKDIIPGFAGQGMGLIHAVRPAAEVMRDLVADAERALGRAAGLR